MAFRTIGVRLRMELGQYRKDTEDAAGQNRKLKGSLDDLGKSGQANLDKLGHRMTLVGAGLAGVAGLVIKTTMAFDRQMSEVGAVSNATADQLGQLRDAAIEAGQATVFSATDAAKAEAELAKAGISTSDILGGALTGSLSLAAAGTLDLADAATISAAAMNTFNLKGSQVGHIADVLAAGANKSAAGVEDLGQGLQQVGLVANQAGLSLEDTVGVLAAFADRGLRGSDGATSLKTALQRLIAPTDEAASTLKRLGISAYDGNGQLVSIVNIAGQLQDKLTTLAPAQRNAALQTVFGSDAIRAANILYAEGAKGIAGYISAVDDQGAASRVAAAKLDNLSGDVEQLTGSLETLTIQSGSGINTGLRTIAQGVTGIVNGLGSLPPPVLTAATVLIGLTGITLLGAAAAIKFKSGWASARDELNKLGPESLTLGTKLGTLAKWAGVAGVAVAALESAGSIIRTAFAPDLETNVDSLSNALVEFSRSGHLAGDAAKILGDNMSDLDAALGFSNSPNAASLLKGIEVIPLLGDAVDAINGNSLDDLSTRLQTLDDALAHMVETGKGDEATQIFERIRAEADKMGVPLEQLQADFPKLIAASAKFTGETHAAAGQWDEAWEGMNGAVKPVIATTKATGLAFDELAKSFGIVTDDAKDLTFAMIALNNPMLDLRDSQRGAEASVDGLDAALKKSKGSLDIHTAAGRDAAAAVDQLAKSAADLGQKTFDETGSTSKADAAYSQYIGTLRKLLLQSGKSKKSVDDLIDSIARIPTWKQAEIKVKAVLEPTGTGWSTLHRMEDKGVQITAHISTAVDWSSLRNAERQIQQGAAVSVSPSNRMSGGITLRHASIGSLRGADMFPAGASPLYAFAEPATRGEAFIPKEGNYGRSMSILSAAAGWYGADVIPRNSWYGSAPAAVNGRVDVNVRVEDPRGQQLHKSLTSYAVQTNRSPADLWPTARR